jgi:hypothetical protein
MGLDVQVFQDDDHEVSLGHVRIGNISAVVDLRRELESFSSEFPILLKQVIHDGTHCGDSIPANLVAGLKSELTRIPHGSEEINKFKSELIGLCEIALKYKRAIVF